MKGRGLRHSLLLSFTCRTSNREEHSVETQAIYHQHRRGPGAPMEFDGPDHLLVVKAPREEQITSNAVKVGSPLDPLHFLYPLKKKEERGENYAFCQSSPLLLFSSGTVAKPTTMAMMWHDIGRVLRADIHLLDSQMFSIMTAVKQMPGYFHHWWYTRETAELGMPETSKKEISFQRSCLFGNVPLMKLFFCLVSYYDTTLQSLALHI